MASARSPIGAGSLAKTDLNMLPFIPEWEHKGRARRRRAHLAFLIFLLNPRRRQARAELDLHREPNPLATQRTRASDR
jgi:hypothetical protein